MLVFRTSANDDQPGIVGIVASGETLGGFHEEGLYLIERPSASAQIYIEDMPLAVSTCGRFWIWSPGFYAGVVRVELDLGRDLEVSTYRLEVAPSSAKVALDQYKSYLKDLADVAPELLLGEQASTYGFSGRRAEIRLWVAYQRLFQYGTRYLTLLRVALARPIVRLQLTREQRDFHRVSRLDMASVSGLMRSPQLICHIVGGSDVRSSVEDFETVDVPARKMTVDNDANRMMRAQLVRVLHLCAYALAEMDRIAARADIDVELLGRFPRRHTCVQRIWRRGSHLLARAPLTEVSNQGAGVAGYNAVARNPAYGAAYDIGNRLLREGVNTSRADEPHTLKTTFDIYEAWCYFALRNALIQRRPDLKWRDRLAPGSSARKLVGRLGQLQVTLYYQLTCRSIDRLKENRYSTVSRERRPDIVLEVRCGETIHYACLDAKYKSSRSRLLEAMESAHIYQDSVRFMGQRPAATFLLCPTVSEVQTLASPKYHESYKVGCLPLYSQADAPNVLDVVLKACPIPKAALDSPD